MFNDVLEMNKFCEVKCDCYYYYYMYYLFLSYLLFQISVKKSEFVPISQCPKNFLKITRKRLVVFYFDAESEIRNLKLFVQDFYE